MKTAFDIVIKGEAGKHTIDTATIAIINFKPHICNE